MTKASGSRIELAYIPEVTPGVTPAGTWLAIRKNTESVGGTRNVIESGESRADLETASDIQGNVNVAGVVNTELYHSSHDYLLRSVVKGGDWVTVDVTEDCDVVSGDYVFGTTKAGVIIPGSMLKFSGFVDAANNGWKLVNTVTGPTVSVAETLVDETNSDDSQTVAGKHMIAGTTDAFFSFSKRYRDIGKHITYGGVIAAETQWTMNPEGVVEVTYTLNGRSETIETDSLPVAATDVAIGDPFDSFSGAVYIDGAENTNVSQMTFKLVNPITDGFVIGTKGKVEQFPGRRNSGGDIQMFFEDLADYTDSAAHVSKSIGISLSSPDDSEHMGVFMPRVYMALAAPANENEGPAFLKGPFNAKLAGTPHDFSLIVSASI